MTGHRYAALDGLRAVAVLLLVASHVAFWTGGTSGGALDVALAHGDVRVAVSFVLSGFLLAMPMVRGAPPPVGAYLRRRALRILPPYWIAVAGALLLLPGNSGVPAVDTLRLLGLAQIYGPDWAIDGLAHTWSVCTVAAFALVLPVLMRVLRPRLLTGLGIVAAVGVGWLAWASAGAAGPVPFNLWLPAFLAWFAAGMALAVVAESGGRVLFELASSPGTCWAGAAVLFWIACTPVAGPAGLDRATVGEALTRHLLYLGVAVLLILPLTVREQPGPIRSLLTSRPMTWLGEISYGVFAYHMIVLIGWYAVTGRQPFSGGALLVLPVTLGGGIVLATASRLLIERPLLAADRRPASEPGLDPRR